MDGPEAGRLGAPTVEIPAGEIIPAMKALAEQPSGPSSDIGAQGTMTLRLAPRPWPVTPLRIASAMRPDLSLACRVERH
jgi:hypothetical protein